MHVAHHAFTSPDAAAPFVGGIVAASGRSTGYSPSYHTMPTRPTQTFFPPLGPPPPFPQPSASHPPSHFSVPFSHFHAHHPTSLYQTTYQTMASGPHGSYPTSWAPSGTPGPGLPGTQDQASFHATIPIAKMDPDLQLLCVPLARLNSPCLTFLLLAAGLY